MPWTLIELRRQRAQQRLEGMDMEEDEEVELVALEFEAIEVELPVAWRGLAHGLVGWSP